METISQIAQSTEVAQKVFGALKERQRWRDRTDLTRLYKQLLEGGLTVAEQEFLGVFKKLEDIGAGSVIIARKKNKPNRFAWKYNLKDVAQAAASNQPIETLKPLEKKKKVAVKRKKKANKKMEASNLVPITKNIAPHPTIQITLQLSPNTDPKEIESYLEMAKMLQQKAN